MEKEKTISKRCWNKFGAISEFARYSPYSICLAADDLSSESFRHCISQELLFLQAFAKAYESAEKYVKNDYERLCVRHLRHSVVHYIAAHDQLVQGMGYSNISDAATEKYTDFLLTTVCETAEREQLAAYILAAVAPCLRLSAYVSNKKIDYNVARRDITHTYRKLIANFSFIETAAVENENVLDELSASLSGGKIEEIESIYHQALKLAVEFYVAQPISQEAIVPFCRVLDLIKCQLTIVCNFDKTCSVLDSFSILEMLAIERASESQLDQLRRSWSCLGKWYKVDHILLTKDPPTDPVPQVNYNLLHNVLKLAAENQKKDNASVLELKLLRDLRLEDIKRAGMNNLQDACRRFFQRIAKSGNSNIDVHVISFCLCGDIIRSAFSSDLNVSSIHSNELVYKGSITTGEIVTKVGSALDKHKYFTDVLKARKTEGNHYTVYIGGKLGDLLCLLEADLGILIDLRACTGRVCRYCGVKLLPLSEGVVMWQRALVLGRSLDWKPFSGIIYVGSWAEVEAFFLGFREFL